MKIFFSVNPLYLHIDHANRYINEKNGNKYLIFDSAMKTLQMHSGSFIYNSLML